MDLVWPALYNALENGEISGKVFCVVDALDEMDCSDFDDPVERLIALSRRKPEKVRLMMTSRPLPKIIQALGQPHIARLKLEPSLLSPDVARSVTSIAA